jgi:CcmD family protein
MLRIVFLSIALATSLAAVAAAQPARPPAAQEEFVPVSDAGQEQLPAAPLVMAAYAVAWLAVFLYVWSIWRRLTRVERELGDVSRRLAERRR